MPRFSISQACELLATHYPTATNLKAALAKITQAEREGFVRLWLSEGIPSVFLANPMLFEVGRTWLAQELNLSPKEVTLVGSARIGYSLRPEAFGTAFGSRSDLDLATISERFFTPMSHVFGQWLTDFREGRIAPRNETEGGYWTENASNGPSQIGRGFLDLNKVPNLDRYPEKQKVAQALYSLKVRLQDSGFGHPSVKVTLRAYRDWQAFIAQGVRNLRAL